MPAPVAPRRARAVLVGAMLFLGAHARSAHAQAGAILPLDDPAYAWIDALQSRGALRALSRLERPYHLAEVAQALATEPTALDGDRGRSHAALRYTLERLLEGAEGPRDSIARFAVRGGLTAGIAAQTTGRRQPMLALPADDGVLAPFAGGQLTMGAAPVVAVARLRVDAALRHDPEFPGKKDRRVAGRMEDAYVLATWRHGELFLGRTARSVALPGLPGLQLGAGAYSYDHLFARLGTGAVRFSALLAPLDDEPFIPGRDPGAGARTHVPAPRPYAFDIAPDSLARRWFAWHRLAARIGRVELGVSESIVWGGVGRGVDASLANPLGFWTLSQYSEKASGNPLLGLDAAFRGRRAGTWAAQVVLDDIQIDDCAVSCDEPASYALAFAIDGLPLPASMRAFGSHVRVSNLSYRTRDPWERYTSFDVGLGATESDYDETRVGVEVASGRAIVRPYAALRRQGEGDYRASYPAIAEFPVTPGFLAGVVWRTTRVGIRAHALLPAGGRVELDLGYNDATDAGHVRGSRARGLQGRARVELRGPVALFRHGG